MISTHFYASFGSTSRQGAAHVLMWPYAWQGTVDYAVLRLDEYRQQLQSRVIERYDAAVAGGNLATMAQCARIMSEFQRGQETCVQVRRSALRG